MFLFKEKIPQNILNWTVPQKLANQNHFCLKSSDLALSVDYFHAFFKQFFLVSYVICSSQELSNLFLSICLSRRIKQLLLLFQLTLPSKVVFRQRSSSIKDCLPSKVILHQRSASIHHASCITHDA